jgi:hypothetical protein
MNIKISLTILGMILGVAATGLVFLTTTSPVFAFTPEQCDINPDGSFTCSGGQGGRVDDGTSSGNLPNSCEGDTCSGGQGGHITCDAERNCSLQGGSGGERDAFTESGQDIVGGEGHRTTGDFGSGDLEFRGGSGEHLKGGADPN